MVHKYMCQQQRVTGSGKRLVGDPSTQINSLNWNKKTLVAMVVQVLL